MFDWYAQREPISWLAALLALGLLLSPLIKYRPVHKDRSIEEIFAIQMEAPPEIAEPREPQPVVSPPPPRHEPLLARRLDSPTAPNLTARSDAVAAAEIPTPMTPVAAALPATAASAVPVVPQVQHNVSSEENYVTSIRGYLNSIKRYPTGREASIQRPRGKTRVWFMLSRDGRILEAGIDESSDSLLLDRTALATVQRGGFPPFPETAWSSQTSHRFTVELEFIPSS